MSVQQTPPRGLTAIIALLTMLGPFTIDTYLPAFPAIEAEYGVGRALMSHSLTAYLIAFAVATLFLGPLADRLGRRVVILASLFIYFIASVACALADNYQSFLIFRLLQGAAAGGGLMAGRAMIRDVYSPQDAQKAMSRVMMLFALAPAIAPIIGGWLHNAFGWHSIFYFLALYSVILFFVILFLISETLPHSHRQSYHPINVARVYGQTFTHPRFQLLVLISSLYFVGMFIYIAATPTLVFDFLQLGVSDFGKVFIPMVIGIIAGSWLSGWLAHRWTGEKTIKLSLLVMAVGVLLNSAQALLLTPMVIATVVPLVVYCMGIGIAMPAMSILILDCFPKNRGAASAMQGFVQMMGNAAGVSILLPLLMYQPIHLALGQLLLLILALLLWYRLTKKQ